MSNFRWNDIDAWRKAHLAVAEAIDAWRIVPRLLVGAYSYLIFYVIKWYTQLQPYIIEGCTSQIFKDCIVDAPTTQHAALVTIVVGASAGVFGLYTNTGKKWNGFTNWGSSSTTKAKDD